MVVKTYVTLKYILIFARSRIVKLSFLYSRLMFAAKEEMCVWIYIPSSPCSGNTTNKIINKFESE